ncbi:DCC1-like thiol-disulfide oxidoreductase family protein [Vampirovibrio sp.]|uniref:DCC1-like thiol-disulfide oxidoreductase family protein n=1 Tax=Vampirovibrio sp. TaxID=2717857 RepID=UPI0035932239
MDAMTLIYDGDCPLCIAGVQKLADWGFLQDIHTQAWQAFSNPEPILAERIKTEFLLLGPSNQVWGGFEVLSHLAMRRFPWVKPFFDVPGVNRLGKFFYKLVAMNRRIIAPSGNIPCDCDPPFHLGWRAGFWAILLVIILIGSAIFGASLGLLQSGKSYLETGLQWMTVAGSGWVLNFLVFAMVLPKRYGVFIQQCLVVMAMATLGLLPFALINLLGVWFHVTTPILLKITLFGLLLNSLILFRVLSGDLRRLKFPDWAAWLWFLLLQAMGLSLSVSLKLFH